MIRLSNKIHVYEIDFLRAFTALAVVAVHVISGTTSLQTTHIGIEIQTLLYHTLHFTREMFMFVTAFVLVFVYYDKKYSKLEYWYKRLVVVLIPYILWSAIYVKISTSYSGLYYLKTLLYDIVTGNASFQLYYIVLTLQFYIVFPYLLELFRKIVKHPFRVLIISFILQLIIYYLDFKYLESGILVDKSRLFEVLSKYENRIFVFYEFYFILGAYAAVYFKDIKTFLLKYKLYIVLIYIVTLLLFCLNFIYQVTVLQMSVGYASSVLQPIMAFYSLAVILFVGLVAVLWGGNDKQVPHGGKIMLVIASTTFGIYLVHPIFLTFAQNYILPYIKQFHISIITIILYLFTAGLSVALSLFFLYLPGFEWVIGKPTKIGLVKNIKAIWLKFFKLNKDFLVLLVSFSLVISLLEIGLGISNTKQLISHPKVISMDSSILGSPSIDYSPILTGAGCGNNDNIHPGILTEAKIKVGGLTRTYLIYVPKNFDNHKPYPLVLNFHGFHSNAIAQAALTGFNLTADKYGIILVYPQGDITSLGVAGWNTGLHKKFTDNDVLFVSDILNSMQQNYCINPSRIYATGFSNGGGMVNLLACTLSTRIAAFAPVDGSYVTPWTECNPQSVVSILEFHGTADETVPYNGNPLNGEPSILSWETHWALIDKCDLSPSVIPLNRSIVEYRWNNCKNGSNVINYTVENGHHDWPHTLPMSSQGNDAANINDVIWHFFMMHSLGDLNTSKGTKSLANST